MVGKKAEKKDTSSVRDLARDAYERVRSAIQDGQLSIGERVTEAELAARFGVSRTPIREAIARLEADGLLTNEPRRGLIVTDLSHQQIVELYTMREILEGAAARLTAQSASDTELATLANLVEAEGRFLDNPSKLSDINRNFHHLLTLAAHNRYLLRSLNQLSITMSLLPSLLHEGDRAVIAHEQHASIMAALSKRDGETAERIVRQHVRDSQRHRMLIMLGTHSGPDTD
ncbi:GntR family transcriptional regulator [Allorhizobium borbori]|uniref:DNA-binding GntR family transcriptional regulator n=1 Tax=Allorhizobium borbori TaxID=485907 RepID=A0A7W6K3D1_9HYPH|nr:GntR family transcriptional regulator [Allorhizobium borbori]MBB4104428.1 DNA-binding GntR family transcriptional regulator [Allorhizobium borbori]PZU25416.1 MAG: GntR family transcriptional regulator [Shinella sp.]